MKIKEFLKENLRGEIDLDNTKDVINAIKEISKWVHSGDESRIKIFEMGEKNNIHITPVHFYQPIPDTRKISPEIFNKSHHAGFDFRENEQLILLKELSKYSDEIKDIPRKSAKNKKQYYFENEFFPPLDGVIYYSMIREFSPEKIIEVGSGFSTMIASQAAEKNKTTKITLIEPFPNKILKSGLPNLDELVQSNVQDIPISKFQELEKNDILFIDSSHISNIGSDVNYLFLHVIPELKPGVIIHVHDFFFPFEYPNEFIKRKLFWNEMYLVWAFLIGNCDYEILLSNFFLFKKINSTVNELFPFIKEVPGGAGSLWLRKK